MRHRFVHSMSNLDVHAFDCRRDCADANDRNRAPLQLLEWHRHERLFDDVASTLSNPNSFAQSTLSQNPSSHNLLCEPCQGHSIPSGAGSYNEQSVRTDYGSKFAAIGAVDPFYGYERKWHPVNSERMNSIHNIGRSCPYHTLENNMPSLSPYHSIPSGARSYNEQAVRAANFSRSFHSDTASSLEEYSPPPNGNSQSPFTRDRHFQAGGCASLAAHYEGEGDADLNTADYMNGVRTYHSVSKRQTSSPANNAEYDVVNMPIPIDVVIDQNKAEETEEPYEQIPPVAADPMMEYQRLRDALNPGALRDLDNIANIVTRHYQPRNEIGENNDCNYIMMTLPELIDLSNNPETDEQGNLPSQRGILATLDSALEQIREGNLLVTDYFNVDRELIYPSEIDQKAGGDGPHNYEDSEDNKLISIRVVFNNLD